MSSIFTEWANFWYDLGANVFPCYTTKKSTDIEWSRYQNKPIDRTQLDKWINGGIFDHYNGMGVMAGRLHRGKFEGKYLTIIDLDNRQAIEEFCGGYDNLMRLSKDFIVEMHLDNPNKAHIYFFTDRPVPPKASNSLGMEVKSTEGNIVYCTPSMHKDGHRYEIVGTTNPEKLVRADELKTRVADIYKKHDIPYNNTEYR